MVAGAHTRALSLSLCHSLSRFLSFSLSLTHAHPLPLYTLSLSLSLTHTLCLSLSLSHTQELGLELQPRQLAQAQRYHIHSTRFYACTPPRMTHDALLVMTHSVRNITSTTRLDSMQVLHLE